jgi:hypothetical protein
MPIRFACPRCKQLLGVAVRKAGTQVTCPKCKSAIAVPTADEAATGSFLASHPIEPNPTEAPDVMSRFATPEIEETLNSLIVYDRPADGTSAARTTRGDARDADDERRLLLIPRKVVYFQAGLLALVALLFFVAGWWIGGGSSPSSPQADSARAPGHASLDVLLHYQGADGQLRPDEGAVVLVLPADKRVTDKFSAAELDPKSPPPNAASPITVKLNLLGAAYGRTNASGKLAGLVTPAAGKHHVLLLSNHARRTGEPRPADLAALGTYLEGAAELLADRQYRLTSEELSGAMSMAHDFGER